MGEGEGYEEGEEGAGEVGVSVFGGIIREH